MVRPAGSISNRWHEAGVWTCSHAVLLAELNAADQIDWRRGLDRRLLRQGLPREATIPAPTPRIAVNPGCKHHVLTDAQGIPLAATVTAANVNEVTKVFDVLTNMPPVGGKPGPPREKPGAAARRYRLRLRAGPAVVAVAGHHSDHGRTETGTWQWPGGIPLVRGTDDRLAA